MGNDGLFPATPRGGRGFVLVYFLFFLPVLAAMLAWTVDLTRLRLVKNQLWAACDAAAHAGAAEARLFPGEAEHRLVDDNGDGRPDRVVVTVKWYRLLINEGEARSAAWSVFEKNVRDRGWTLDGKLEDAPKGVVVYSWDFSGRAGSSKNRPDVCLDEYTVSARAVVRTYFTGAAVNLARAVFQRYSGPPALDPVTEEMLRRGEVIVSASATARARVSGVQVGP